MAKFYSNENFAIDIIVLLVANFSNTNKIF